MARFSVRRLFVPFVAETAMRLELPAEEVERGLRELAELLARGGAEPVEPERAPSPQTKPEKVEAGMAQHRIIRAEYTRVRDGGTEEYFLRPYSVKPHPMSGRPVLYAQDSKHGGQIHSFLWGRLRGVMMTDNKFSPTWPTEPDTVP